MVPCISTFAMHKVMKVDTMGLLAMSVGIVWGERDESAERALDFARRQEVAMAL